MKKKVEKLEKVYEYLRSKGILHTKKEFASAIQFDYSNLTSAFQGGQKYLTEGLFRKICDKYSEFNVEWLLHDEGEMLNQPDSIEQMQADNIAESIFVPLLPLCAQGGTLDDFVVSVKNNDCEKVISPIKGADFAITVSGDSMAPEYPSGAQILIKRIDEKAFIEWGKVYVLDTCNGTVIKTISPSSRDGYLKCISINPDPKYASFEISLDDIFGVYRVLMCMSVK